VPRRGYKRDLLLALLANPASGRGDAPGVERMLRDCGAEVRSFRLDERDDAVALGPERIVVAGGDGSIGLAAEAAAGAGVPLAVVPAGTANDFARALEIPLDPVEACRLAVEGSGTRSLELGWMGERPFVNLASTGLSPVAAAKAHGLKRIFGPLAYSVGALRAGVSTNPIRCLVSCDGRPLFDGRAWQVSVAVTGAFGGGSGIEADPHDGEVDVVVIAATSRARLVVHGYGLRAGRLESQRGVLSARARVVEVRTEGETGFNVDGELIEADGARFRAQARAFRVVQGPPSWLRGTAGGYAARSK
jgi:diacylglycerol kinase (ATP)